MWADVAGEWCATVAGGPSETLPVRWGISADPRWLPPSRFRYAPRVDGRAAPRQALAGTICRRPRPSARYRNRVIATLVRRRSYADEIDLTSRSCG